jgi:hypothetical protein
MRIVQSAAVSQVGSLQLPPLRQSMLQSEPSWQVTLGQLEPPLMQVKSQVAPASQITFQPLQLPLLLQLNVHVEPPLHTTSPEQTLPVFWQPKVHSRSAAQLTFTPAHFPLLLQAYVQSLSLQ